MLHVSVIATVYNEQESIVRLIEALSNQTRIPDEVVIVDAESSDSTYQLLQECRQKFPTLHLSMYRMSGNRSVGRNVAIRNAQYEIIAATDAGCTLDPHWLQELLRPFEESTQSVDVVAGWYQPLVQSNWERTLGLVYNFSPSLTTSQTMPSSRSIAFRKSIWEKVGGYPEHVPDAGEDTLFNVRLHESGARFVFTDKALVWWQIPSTVRQLYRQQYRYALGDGTNRLWLSQYKILAAWWTLLFTCVFLSFFMPIFIGAGICLIVAYGYLPLLLQRRISGPHDVWRAPLQKYTIVLGTTIGYIRGLLK